MTTEQKSDFSAINDENRSAVIEWLRDRSAFHTWFSSIVTGSFVVVTVFGAKPGFASPSGVVLSLAVALLILALVCNLVCVWSIPSWKYRVSTRLLTNSSAMRRELSITAWAGVITFVAGLTLAFVANTSA